MGEALSTVTPVPPHVAVREPPLVQAGKGCRCHRPLVWARLCCTKPPPCCKVNIHHEPQSLKGKSIRYLPVSRWYLLAWSTNSSQVLIGVLTPAFFQMSQR